MNINCNNTGCAGILGSQCVFYEGRSLPFIGINTNDSVEVCIQKIQDAIVSAGVVVAWGTIVGTVTDQTDLISYLSSNYYPSSNPSNYVDCAGVPACETDPVFSAWLAGPPDITEFTNNAGYITASSVDNLTNKTGLISQWTNDVGYITSISGYVPDTRTLTINGVSFDLGANRTWSVGTVTNVTASSPLASSGGATPNITIQQSSAIDNGYLSSTDWSTFNGKQNAITLTTTGTSGPATFAANTLNIPQYQAAGSYVTSVSGTLNRISSTGGTTPIIDIDSNYVGQASITTLGTITTGVWNGTDIAYANIAQGAALSVLGVAGNATSDLASIQGTANQILRVNSAGTVLAFGSIDISQAGSVGSSILGPANGGTGVANNAASTITISGNFATTFTISGVTGVTLPTTGTLATLAGAESLTNKKLGSLTSNGFVKTSGGDGTLSVDTNTYQASGLSWLLASGGTLTGANTIAQAGFDISFLNGNILSGPTGATITASTRLDVRGTGTTTGNALRIADSANTTRLTFLDNGVASYSQAAQSATNVMSTWTQAVHTGGSPSIFSVVGGAHTTLANAEAADLFFNLSRTVQFGQNTLLALQRAVVFDFNALVYSSSAATKTITTAIGVAIKGAPTQGTNVSITNFYALAVTSGADVVEIGLNAHNVNYGALVFGSVSRASAPSIGAATNGTTFSNTGTNMKFQTGAVNVNGRVGYNFASTGTIAFPAGTSTNHWIYSATAITNSAATTSTHNHVSMLPDTAAVTDATLFTLNVFNSAPVINIAAGPTAVTVRGFLYNPTETALGVTKHYGFISASATALNGFGLLTPANAYVVIGAGTTTIAPFKLTSGTNLTTAVAGCMEYNGTNLFFTRTGTTREGVLVGNRGATAPATNTIGTIADYYGTSGTRVLTTPNTWFSVVGDDGNTYKIPGYS